MTYREAGFLPHAMVNFLALLGWSLDGKTELFSAPELIKHFSLERVSKSGAIFDLGKLNWMNGHYIRELSADELADALLDYWRRYPLQELPGTPDKSYVLQIVPLVRERLKTLGDAAGLVSFFFKPRVEYPSGDLVQKGMDPEGTRTALERALHALDSLGQFDAESIEGVLRPLAADLGLRPAQLFGALRIATTGQPVAPPLFQTMAVLGRDRCAAAIREAIGKL
jgi:glutamyl-tRNA synthetase